jgi:hypothetical protein
MNSTLAEWHAFFVLRNNSGSQFAMSWTRTILLTSVCFSALALLGADNADAQRRVPGFVNKPAISPYVNLFQGNNGGLNSYFSFVRPRMEMDAYVRQTNQRQAMTRQYIDQEAQMIQNSLQSALEDPGLSLRPASNTARFRPAGGFMNYSTFFPQQGPSARR